MPAIRKLGPALRALRCRRSVTQVEASALSGIRQSEISRIELDDEPNIQTATLGKLLDAYKADLFDLAVEVRAAQAVPAEQPLSADEAAQAVTGFRGLIEDLERRVGDLEVGREAAPPRKKNGERR